jgi:hypothetical protein
MAYVPPPGQESGATENRAAVKAKLVLLVGMLLMLPGLCSVLFAGTMFLSAPGDFRLGDPILQAVMTFWAICLLVSLGGFLIVRHARNRQRQP